MKVIWIRRIDSNFIDNNSSIIIVNNGISININIIDNINITTGVDPNTSVIIIDSISVINNGSTNDSISIATNGCISDTCTQVQLLLAVAWHLPAATQQWLHHPAAGVTCSWCVTPGDPHPVGRAGRAVIVIWIRNIVSKISRNGVIIARNHNIVTNYW